MKNDIIILSSDSIRNPFGGLGIYLQRTLEIFSKLYPDLKFLVVGPNTDESHVADNYMYTSLENDKIVNKIASKAQDAKLIHAMDFGAFNVGSQLSNVMNLPLALSLHLSIGLLYKDIAKQVDSIQPRKEALKMELNHMEFSDTVIHVAEGYMNRFPIHLRLKSHVVHNGINIAPFQKARKRNLPGKNSKKIVYIGRLAYQKGLHNLVETKIPDNCDLIIATKFGSNSMRLEHQMRGFIAQNDNVHFVGPQWGKDKHRLLKSADAVLFPSIHEPFGIVGLEALASESVLLASNVDGMKDYLEEGMFVDTGVGVTSMQEALFDFSFMQPKKAKKYTDRGLQIARRFTWPAAVKKLKSVYDKFIN